jgi:hypothetical protein
VCVVAVYVGAVYVGAAAVYVGTAAVYVGTAGGDGSGGGGNVAGSDIASNSLVLVLLFRQLRGCEHKSDGSVSCGSGWSVPCVSIQLTLSQVIANASKQNACLGTCVFRLRVNSPSTLSQPSGYVFVCFE